MHQHQHQHGKEGSRHVCTRVQWRPIRNAPLNSKLKLMLLRHKANTITLHASRDKQLNTAQNNLLIRHQQPLYSLTTTHCIIYKVIFVMDDSTVITNYDVIGWKSEALIRINFMLGTFHQPQPTLHKRVTFVVSLSQFCVCYKVDFVPTNDMS